MGQKTCKFFTRSLKIFMYTKKVINSLICKSVTEFSLVPAAAKWNGKSRAAGRLNEFIYVKCLEQLGYSRVNYL